MPANRGVAQRRVAGIEREIADPGSLGHVDGLSDALVRPAMACSNTASARPASCMMRAMTRAAAPAKMTAGDPGRAGCSRSGDRGQERNCRKPDAGTLRPEPEPHILLAGAVVFDRDQQARPGQRAARDLEVPAVVWPAVGDVGALPPDRLPHVPAPRLPAPASAPTRSRFDNRRGSRDRAAARHRTRRQPVANATVEPSERLR